MAATDTGLTFTYANVPGFCCAKSTTYDNYLIWVSTNGKFFRKKKLITTSIIRK